MFAQIQLTEAPRVSRSADGLSTANEMFRPDRHACLILLVELQEAPPAWLEPPLVGFRQPGSTGQDAKRCNRQ